MDQTDAFLATTLPRLRHAETALHNGDAGPRMAMWSHDHPVTLFGGVMGGSGWEEIEPIFRRLGALFSDCSSYDVEVIAAAASDGLAYTVAFEHTTASVNGGPPSAYVLRVTTVFRREDGEWKVVHRHADPLGSTNAGVLSERAVRSRALTVQASPSEARDSRLQRAPPGRLGRHRTRLAPAGDACRRRLRSLRATCAEPRRRRRVGTTTEPAASRIDLLTRTSDVFTLRLALVPAPPVDRTHPLHGVGRPGPREPRGGREPALHDAAPRRHGGRGRRHPHGRPPGRRPGFIVRRNRGRVARRLLRARCADTHDPPPDRRTHRRSTTRDASARHHRAHVGPRPLHRRRRVTRRRRGRLRAHPTRHPRGRPRTRVLRPGARRDACRRLAPSPTAPPVGTTARRLQAIRHDEDAVLVAKPRGRASCPRSSALASTASPCSLSTPRSARERIGRLRAPAATPRPHCHGPLARPGAGARAVNRQT